MRKRTAIPLAILSTIAVGYLGALVLGSDPVRCDNIGWFTDPQVEIASLVVQVGAPICIARTPSSVPTLEIAVSQSWFAEAGRPDHFPEGPYRIELSASNNRLLSYTEPWENNFKFKTNRYINDHTSVKTFEKLHIFTSPSLYDGEAAEPVTFVETIVQKQNETPVVTGSTWAFYRWKGYKSPFVNRVTYQWERSFSARFVMWAARDEPREQLQDRAIRLAAKVRDFVETISQAP